MAPMSQAGLPLQSPDWIISPEKEVNSVDALFNVIAASFAFWLTALGTEKILRGLFGRTFVADSVGMRVTPIGLNRFVLGISLITLALLVSDLSNKFVETARDANWFT
jgi:hypothetical protein